MSILYEKLNDSFRATNPNTERKKPEFRTIQEGARISAINNLRDTVRNKFLEALIIETAYEALPLDNEEKEVNKEAIEESMRETLREFVDVNAFFKSEPSTMLLAKYKKLAENAADDKVEDSIDKGIEPAMSKEFNENDRVNVTDTVKSVNGETKVVDKIEKNVVDAVVADEKAAKEKAEEDAKTDEKIQDKVPNEDGIVDGDAPSEGEQTGETEQDIQEASLFKAIAISKGKEIIKEGMDMKKYLLAETLVTYTLMETLQTLQFIKVNHLNVREIKERFIMK